MEYQPHQERVIEERAQLVDKVDKLDAFLFGKTFNSLAEVEQLRLLKQLAYMKMYLNVLGERIAEFK